MSEAIPRAAIYVRVSTDEQAEAGYSLDAQKEKLENYCIAEGWDIFRIYEDDGFSGRNISRPAYRKMMEERDQWDVMLVMKMDRIHRNSRNFMAMMDQLNHDDKKFVSCLESLDTTNAMGRFVADMIQRLAQLESEQIGERTQMGMEEKADTLRNTESENRTMGFSPPFGYRMEGGLLLRDEDEMPYAERIFKEYSSGDTLDMIAYRLNSNGISTRRGNPWTKYNVRAVLHNPIYAGYMDWNGHLIKHYAGCAVTSTEFNSIQERMRRRVRAKNSKPPLEIPETDFE